MAQRKQNQVVAMPENSNAEQVALDYQKWLENKRKQQFETELQHARTGSTNKSVQSRSRKAIPVEPPTQYLEEKRKADTKKKDSQNHVQFESSVNPNSSTATTGTTLTQRRRRSSVPSDQYSCTTAPRVTSILEDDAVKRRNYDSPDRQQQEPSILHRRYSLPQVSENEEDLIRPNVQNVSQQKNQANRSRRKSSFSSADLPPLRLNDPTFNTIVSAKRLDGAGEAPFTETTMAMNDLTFLSGGEPPRLDSTKRLSTQMDMLQAQLSTLINAVGGTAAPNASTLVPMLGNISAAAATAPQEVPKPDSARRTQAAISPPSRNSRQRKPRSANIIASMNSADSSRRMSHLPSMQSVHTNSNHIGEENGSTNNTLLPESSVASLHIPESKGHVHKHRHHHRSHHDHTTGDHSRKKKKPTVTLIRAAQQADIQKCHDIVMFWPPTLEELEARDEYGNSVLQIVVRNFVDREVMHFSEDMSEEQETHVTLLYRDTVVRMIELGADVNYCAPRPTNADDCLRWKHMPSAFFELIDSVEDALALVMVQVCEKKYGELTDPVEKLKRLPNPNKLCLKIETDMCIEMTCWHNALEKGNLYLLSVLTEAQKIAELVFRDEFAQHSFDVDSIEDLYISDWCVDDKSPKWAKHGSPVIFALKEAKSEATIKSAIDILLNEMATDADADNFLTLFDPNATDENQQTMLHVACARGYDTIVGTLLRYCLHHRQQHGIQVNINAVDHQGCTALMLAIDGSHSRTVHELFLRNNLNYHPSVDMDETTSDNNTGYGENRYADPSRLDEYKFTSQFPGSPATYRSLNIHDGPRRRTSFDFPQDNFVVGAAGNRQVNKSSSLLSQTVVESPSFRDNSRRSNQSSNNSGSSQVPQSHNAQYQDRPKLARQVTTAGDDLAWSPAQGTTLQRQHNLGIRSHYLGFTALHYACSSQSELDNVVLTLCKHKANVNLADDHGFSPLHLASMLGHIMVVKVLLRYNANPSKTIKEGPLSRGEAALHLAAGNGHINVVAKLIAKGSEVTMENVEGRTPLHFAYLHLRNLTSLAEQCSMDLQDRQQLQLNFSNNKTLGNSGRVSSKKIEPFRYNYHERSTSKQWMLEHSGHPGYLRLARESQEMLIKILLDSNADLDHEDKLGRTAFVTEARLTWFEEHKVIMTEIFDHPNEMGYDSEVFIDKRTQASVKTKWIRTGQRTRAMQDLLWWLIFTATVTTVAVWYSGKNSLQSSSFESGMREKFLGEEWDDREHKIFEEVATIEEWHMYVRGPLFAGLYEGGYPFQHLGQVKNQDPFFPMVNGFVSLLGRPRYRQVRTVPTDCTESTVPLTNNTKDTCFGHSSTRMLGGLRVGVEDKDSVMCGNLTIPYNTRDAVVIWGDFGRYNGDGVSITLPHDPSEAEELIQKLEHCNYVSLNTRLAVVEFTLYTRADGLFSHVRVFMEQTVSGSVTVNSKWDTLKLISYSSWDDSYRIIVELLMLVMLLQYMFSEFFAMGETWDPAHITDGTSPRWWWFTYMDNVKANDVMTENPYEFRVIFSFPRHLCPSGSLCAYKTSRPIPPYWVNAFNYVDVFLMALFCTAIAVHAAAVVEEKTYISDWTSEDSTLNEDYYDMQRIIKLVLARQYLLATILFLCYIKCLEFIQVSEFLAIPVIVIGGMLVKLMSFFLIFGIFILAFGMFNYVVYGLSYEHANTVVKAILHSFRASLGDIDFDGMLAVDSGAGIFMALLASFLLVILLLNLLVAIMNEAYEDVKATAEARWCYMQFRMIITDERKKGRTGKVIGDMFSE